MDAQAEKKLLQSLQDEGKFVPEFVWFDEEGGEWYAMDGHQRLSIYAKHDITFNDSYDVPFLKAASMTKRTPRPLTWWVSQAEMAATTT